MVVYRSIVNSLLLSGRGRRRSVSRTWAFWGGGTDCSSRSPSSQPTRSFQTALAAHERPAAVVASVPEQAPYGPVPISKLLVANRGEIACRVIATAQRLDIPTVTVFSEADRAAIHARSADEAFCIGPAAARDSYLRMDRILEVRHSVLHAFEEST